MFPSNPIAIDCGEPPDIPNGTRIFSSTTVNSTAIYECNYGFEISDGSEMIICDISGNWNDVPSCQSKW